MTQITEIQINCAHDKVVPLVELTPNPRNPNTHNERQIELLAKVIRHQGWRAPITVSTRSGFVVAGHGRLEAATLLGVEGAPVDFQDFESEAAEHAHMVADNRIAELAEINDDVLKDVLLELDTGEIDMDLTGFDSKELESLMTQFHVDEEPTDAEPQIDRAAELQEKWGTAAGQVWKLGNHRLMCGDCRSAEDVAKLFDGALINVAVTSPPYASQRKYDETSGFKPIPPDEFSEWFASVAENVKSHLADDGSWFVNIKEHCEEGQRSLYVKDLTLDHVRKWGWNFVEEYVWTHGGTPKRPANRFKNGWEPIFHFARGPFKFNPNNVMHKSETASEVDWGGRHPSQNDGQGLREWKDAKGGPKDVPQGEGGQGKGLHAATLVASDGMAYPSNVLSLGKNKVALGHGAAFPTSLPLFFINAYSDEGDVIFDPFTGSGTTLMAAEQSGRSFYGSEIAASYVAVTIERWHEATGKEPELVG